MTQNIDAINNDCESQPIKTIDLMHTKYASSQAIADALHLDADEVKKAMAKVTGFRASPGDAAILTIGDHSNLTSEVYCNAAGFVAASPFLMPSNTADCPRGEVKQTMSEILNQLLKLQGEYAPDFNAEDHDGTASPLQVMALKNALNESWLADEEENSKSLALRLAEALHDLNVMEGARDAALEKVDYLLATSSELYKKIESLQSQIQEAA